MNILQVCHKPPFSGADGGSKAQENLCKSLIELGYKVDIITISTSKHPFDKNKTPEWFSSKGSIEHIEVDTNYNVLSALGSLIDSSSLAYKRFENIQLEQLVKLKASKYDLLILDGLPAGQLALKLKNCPTPIVYRSHNIEHKLWIERAALQEGIKGSFLKRESKKIKDLELQVWNSVQQIWHISLDEIDELGYNIGPLKVFHIPYFIQEQNIVVDKPSNFTIGFLGAFNWPPNETAFWFFKKLLESNDDINGVIAGKFQSENIKSVALPNLKNLGTVNNLEQFYNHVSVFTAPIFSGSGVKIKLYDTILHQKPLISTKKGVEGLGLIPDVHYLHAETLEDFVNAIHLLKSDDGKINSLSTAALDHLQEQFGLSNGRVKITNAINAIT